MINLTDSLSACTASGILAYAKQIYQQMSGGTATNVEDLLNEHEAKIQSAIKLNEYDEVNITYPIYEEGGVGSILCNLVKDDDKIIQDHSAWGSEFADYVRNSHLYIGTNFGNSGIGVLENDDFLGYKEGEEIVNVTDSNDKSTIANCIKSPHGYWIIQTESELTASDNLYSSIGNYRQKRDITPFRLEQNGSLYLMNVGGYDGNKNTAHNSLSLQEVIGELEEQIASGSSGGSSGVTSDSDWVNEVLPGAILVSGVTITAKWITDTKRGNYVYLGFEADREVNWDLFNIDVYDWNSEQHYNRNIHDSTRIVNDCLMTELNQLSTLSGDTEAISTQEICIKGKPSFGYSYTIDYDESIENQMYENWWIDNNGDNISY